MVEGSCASIKVKALAQGHTELKVVYQFKDIRLKASVTIAAYRPLRVRIGRDNSKKHDYAVVFNTIRFNT